MKPSRALLALLGVLLAIAIALGAAAALDSGSELLARLWWGALCALILLALADALWLRRTPSPELQRQLSGNLPLGRWSEVRLQFHHRYAQPQRITVFDHLPAGMAFEYLPQTVELHPGEQTELGYRVRPLSRGHFVFPRCEIELSSPLRLWKGRRYLEQRDETRVYPDFARIYGAELMAVDHWLNRIGVRSGQRRGLGLDFHQLREFRDGDTRRLSTTCGNVCSSTSYRPGRTCRIPTASIRTTSTTWTGASCVNRCARPSACKAAWPCVTNCEHCTMSLFAWMK